MIITILTWAFRAAALVFLCISAYHDAKTREIADAYTLSFAACGAAVGFLTGETISAAVGLAVAALFAILPDSARFGGADGIVYAGLLASFGLKAFPIILISSCVVAMIVWTFQKVRKPASCSATTLDYSAPSNTSCSATTPKSSTSDVASFSATALNPGASTENMAAAVADSENPDREGVESFAGVSDTAAVGDDGEDEDETDEEGDGVAMLPMILVSLAFSLPTVYLWWFPMLANI